MGPVSCRVRETSMEASQRMESGPSGRSPLRVAAWIFGGILAGWASLVLASAALFADLGVLFDPEAPGTPHPTLRFAATLALVLAYTTAAAHLGRRFLRQE